MLPMQRIYIDESIGIRYLSAQQDVDIGTIIHISDDEDIQIIPIKIIQRSNDQKDASEHIYQARCELDQPIAIRRIGQPRKALILDSDKRKKEITVTITVINEACIEIQETISTTNDTIYNNRIPDRGVEDAPLQAAAGRRI